MTNEQRAIRTHAEALVRLTRGVYDTMLQQFGVDVNDLRHSDLRMQLEPTTFAMDSNHVVNGFALDVSAQHPTEPNSRISMTLMLNDDFERIQDDVLSVEEAAKRGVA